MRLIDADILIKQLEKCKNNAIGTYPISIVDSNIELVNKQPTAYDVNKVVEQLEDESEIYCREYGKEDELYLKGAIDIVKEGGVEC
nr:MAG TPA: hypothetical protein [Caudoviricetes sp.]